MKPFYSKEGLAQTEKMMDETIDAIEDLTKKLQRAQKSKKDERNK